MRDETGMEIVEERGMERKGREWRVRETEWKRERRTKRGGRDSECLRRLEVERRWGGGGGLEERVETEGGGVRRERERRQRWGGGWSTEESERSSNSATIIKETWYLHISVCRPLGLCCTSQQPILSSDSSPPLTHGHCFTVSPLSLSFTHSKLSLDSYNRV